MNEIQAKTFYELMKQYLVFYKEFLEFEKIKLEDVTNNRIDLIDEHVKKEEVFLLRSKGFEVKREAFLKELGFENLTMSEIIEKTPQDFKEKVSSLFSELSEVLLDLKEINSRCNSMIELRLHRIEKTLNQLDENQQKQHNDSAKKPKNRSDFISRKV